METVLIGELPTEVDVFTTRCNDGDSKSTVGFSLCMLGGGQNREACMELLPDRRVLLL